MKIEKYDVVIIGAGAAGLMCAIEAGKRHRRVLVVDHANKAGKKILMSGGGRCNFTNLTVTENNFISHNPHFCKSALKRYTSRDFINMVEQHQIPYHEKKLGQLFCDNKAQEILSMLLNLCQKANVPIRLNSPINAINKKISYFELSLNTYQIHCDALVIATGGLSIPTMGATPFGYQLAQQFGLKVYPTRAGLVPITLHQGDKEQLAPLSGVSLPANVFNSRIAFEENILFTHRGLSGPGILQISSYWQPGEEISIDLYPYRNLYEDLLQAQSISPKKIIKNLLLDFFPRRFIEIFFSEGLLQKKLSEFSHRELLQSATALQQWNIKPNATEGYRTAEVTLGGVDCNAISSKTFESHAVSGLYFIGEVLDVTGWLGGYNFQWAWSSGWACGQLV